MTDDFALTEGEKAHPLWVRLKRHLEERLHDARLRNDKALTEFETAGLRGHIACLKSIIALGDEPPLIE
jgi:hypothetical protein